MFKNTNSKRMTGILLALVLVTACFLGGSIARYVTSTSSEDEARVAKWGFSETPEPITMDLFKNEYKLDGNTVVAKSSDDADIIAPGLNGVSKFKFVTSSVSPEVMYEVKISVDDSEIADEIKNHPGIQWKVDNGNWVTWDEMVASLVSLSGDPSGMKVYAPGELHNNFKNTTDHTIAWQWVMDSGYDVEDTTMGNLAASGTPITAKIVVTVLAQQTDIDSTGMLEGNGSVFNTNDPQPLTFRADADYNTFNSVEVDGTTVTSGNYEKSEGSIKIKLSKDYLASLSLGDHKIAIKTNDGKSIESRFATTNNDTIIHNGIIPEGGIYYSNTYQIPEDQGFYGPYEFISSFVTNSKIYKAGDKFPTPKTGDVYTYKDYTYICDFDLMSPRLGNPNHGWSVLVNDKTKESYSPILGAISNKNVTDITAIFMGCTNLKIAPTIPETIERMWNAFDNCSNLKGSIKINVYNRDWGFERMLRGTNITWIEGSISEEFKQAIAQDSGITLIKPTKVITDSWETITQRVKAGKANEYYSVGDKTTVDVNGTEYEVAIAGINHDGENTVTFIFTESLGTTTYSVSNSGGWTNTEMRKTILPQILAKMENKEYIKEVDKKTIKGFANGYTDNTILDLITTQDKLFLLSITEIFGNSSNYNFNEGTQYEYFKTGNSNLGFNYWLRTPFNGDENFDEDMNSEFYYGIWDGNISYDTPSYEPMHTVPAFVIG